MVVDSSSKKVQHPTGGIVGEVHVRDGDHVKAGDILVRLDDTITKANLAIVENELIEQIAQRARLEAERDGGQNIAAPDEFHGMTDKPSVAKAMAGEQRLFEMRRSSRMGQKDQLKKRIDQINDQMGGLDAQVKAKGEEVVLITRERESAENLWKKNLMPINRYIELQRDAIVSMPRRANLLPALRKRRARHRKQNFRSSKSIEN